MSFSPELLDEIRSRLDLVELVSAHVPLKKAGANWKGLCPFHAEKTPSFMVNPGRGIFHCFGCGVGGDAFGFLMRVERATFPEAVRRLAEGVGVGLPADRPARDDGLRETLYRAMEWAAGRYQAWLWERPDAERARRYLAERGIGEALARTFRLGYAPEGWDHLLAAARAEGLEAATLELAGLVLPRQTGPGHYDRFRGRLLFPIGDPQGRVIAFGGRALAGEEPKYLNSPDTPLYQKGQTLYAFALARERMAATRRALLVEGYFDCLAAHQAGFGETVAVLGTALTASQLGLLRRYADEAVLFFDADRAGAEAARRAEELLEQSGAPLAWAVSRTGAFTAGGFRLRVATLPAGHDPDTFLRREGAEAFRERLGAARNLLGYALERILAEEETGTARGRTTAFARIALMLSKVQDAQEAAELAGEAARRLGVDPTQLWFEAQRLQAAPRRPATPPSPAEPAPVAFERDLVQLLLQRPEARQALGGSLAAEDVTHPGLRAILGALLAHTEVPPEGLVSRLEAEAERALLTGLLIEEREWPEPGQLIGELRHRLELRHRMRRVREMTQAIARAQAAGDPGLADLQLALQAEARQIREMAAGRSDPMIEGGVRP